jgi:hypothetical protein
LNIIYLDVLNMYMNIFTEDLETFHVNRITYVGVFLKVKKIHSIYRIYDNKKYSFIMQNVYPTVHLTFVVLICFEFHFKFA